MFRRLAAFALRRQILAGLRSGTRVDDLLLRCNRHDGAGVNETPEWADWTDLDTTPDQLRIEEVIGKRLAHGQTLLHVGVGNSRLAERFCASTRLIDGITIQENEVRRARRLGIPNYRVVLANKYDSHLAAMCESRYDWIIDNNPTTFCCCRWHLSTMMANYAAMLRPHGVIVTDKVGLGWTSQPNDRRWGLDVDEWKGLAARFGLTGVHYSSFVIGLNKGSLWRSALHTARILAYRSPAG